MDLLSKSDEEIFEIGKPLWDNLVKSSNMRDYGGFTRDFSTQMLFGANEVELGKQWANNKLITNLKETYEPFGTLRRGEHITILIKQTNKEIPGEFLGRCKTHCLVPVFASQYRVEPAFGGDWRTPRASQAFRGVFSTRFIDTREFPRTFLVGECGDHAVLITGVSAKQGVLLDDTQIGLQIRWQDGETNALGIHPKPLGKTIRDNCHIFMFGE